MGRLRARSRRVASIRVVWAQYVVSVGQAWYGRSIGRVWGLYAAGMGAKACMWVPCGQYGEHVASMWLACGELVARMGRALGECSRGAGRRLVWTRMGLVWGLCAAGMGPGILRACGARIGRVRGLGRASGRFPQKNWNAEMAGGQAFSHILASGLCVARVGRVWGKDVASTRPASARGVPERGYYWASSYLARAGLASASYWCGASVGLWAAGVARLWLVWGQYGYGLV